MGDYKQESVAFTGDGNPFGSNMPAQYQGSVRKQYLSTQTKYMLKRAKIACDYVGAQVQGLNADDFFAYTPKKIRLSDVSALSELSAKKSLCLPIVQLLKQSTIPGNPSPTAYRCC
jgi:hypothetical protein